MKRLIVFKNNDHSKYHYGLFSNFETEKTRYELPLINQISHFFSGKIYTNLTLIKSTKMNILENAGGIIIGELDCLMMDPIDKVLYFIEVKNKIIRNIKKQIRNFKIISNYICKWLKVIKQIKNYNYYSIIFYFREPINEQMRSILNKYSLSSIEFPTIRKYVLSKAKNDVNYLLINHNKIINEIKNEIPKDKSIHPLIYDIFNNSKKYLLK